MSCAEDKLCFKGKDEYSWSYLFVHHAKLENILKRLEEAFTVFVHRSTSYHQVKKHVKKEERPTIAGLLFIRGEATKIQSFLNNNFQGLYLVYDCSTHRPAVISDEAMQVFMQFSKLTPNRIRFMPHSFDYYSDGHTLVRITSGPLAGAEGYQVRISRDKCFITTFGGMTVAVGGVVKETFENVEEYVKQQKRMQCKPPSLNEKLTAIQKEIDACFFTPKNELDVLSIIVGVEEWLSKVEILIRQKQFDPAMEMLLVLLDRAGYYFQAVYDKALVKDLVRVNAISSSILQKIQELLSHSDIALELRQHAAERTNILLVQYPFLLTIV